MNVDGRDRRWSATITYGDDHIGLCMSPPHGETIQADMPSEDLQKSMAAAAYLEACTFLLSGCAKHAYIQLYKTTKAHGTVKDHTSYLIDVQDAVKYARRKITKAFA